MLEVKYSTKFKRDLKVCQKRHYDMADYDLPAMQRQNEAQHNSPAAHRRAAGLQMCCPIMRIFKWTFCVFDWMLFGILRAKVCSNAQKRHADPLETSVPFCIASVI